MWGSKKYIVRNVASAKLYPEFMDKLNLFNQAMVQTAASYKTLDSQVMGESLLLINKKLNYYTLGKLEAAVYDRAEHIEVVDNLLEIRVASQDPDYLAIESQTNYSGAYYSAHYWLTKDYGRKELADCPDTYTYLVDGRRVVIMDAEEAGFDTSGNRVIDISIGECSPNGPVYWRTLNYKYIDSIIIEVFYTYSGVQDTYPKFIVDDANNYLIDDYDNYIVSPDHLQEVPNRVTYVLQEDVIKYSVIKGTNAFLCMVTKWDFIKNVHRYHTAASVVLGIPVKDPVNTPVCNNTWSSEPICEDNDGTDDPESESLLEMADNKEVKHMVATYSVGYNEPYTEIIDKLLGTEGYSITMANGGVLSWVKIGVHYQDGRWWAPDDGYGYKYMDPKTGYAMKMDDYFQYLWYKDENENWVEIEDAEVQYCIPMDWMFLERILPEKYEDIKQSMTYLIYAEKTVKLEFWQRKGFQWVIIAIGAIISAVTLNPMFLIGALSAYAINKLNLSPTLAAIVNIALAFVTMGATAFMTMTNLLNVSLQLVNAIAKTYFTIKIESIKSKIGEVQDETEELEDAIGDMRQSNLYIPIDSISSVYDISTQTDDTVFDGQYDYDKIYYSESALNKT